MNLLWQGPTLATGKAPRLFHGSLQCTWRQMIVAWRSETQPSEVALWVFVCALNSEIRVVKIKRTRRYSFGRDLKELEEERRKSPGKCQEKWGSWDGHCSAKVDQGYVVREEQGQLQACHWDDKGQVCWRELAFNQHWLMDCGVSYNPTQTAASQAWSVLGLH